MDQVFTADSSDMAACFAYDLQAARDLADHVAMNLIFSLDPRTCASAKRMKAVRNAGGAPLPATNSKVKSLLLP